MHHVELEIEHLGGASPAPAPTGRLPPPATSNTHGLAVRASGLCMRYGERSVLRDIDLSIAPGEFVSVVGRSGCGKSTLLRLLAGLETPSGGQILFDGKDPAHHRNETRLMFQDARLLPWKRVLDNVALGLRGPDARDRAREALSQVGLADRGSDWPAALSGGQRQRVALARALVHAPRLLLLDEPLGALDALTRLDMHALIERLWRRHGFTAVLVTHDVSEAIALSDRLLLVDEQQLALEERVPLPRPRSRGPAFDAIEERVLQRVLQRPRLIASEENQT